MNSQTTIVSFIRSSLLYGAQLQGGRRQFAYLHCDNQDMQSHVCSCFTFYEIYCALQPAPPTSLLSYSCTAIGWILCLTYNSFNSDQGFHLHKQKNPSPSCHCNRTGLYQGHCDHLKHNNPPHQYRHYPNT
eukprot:TRINITY_DN66704_c7_g1_i1.p1 TRINITY_DN66704_c7_g1~~TRINITY_DN66704_c7_g1_i1.p1  ORF type:complete len:131 (-),score=2.32 TRINITY_DN66704_c7_g1_i1:193-585(-)